MIRMIKRSLIVLTLLSMISIFLYIRFNKVEVKAPSDYPVHNLDTGLNYTTIQAAITASETLAGHTIFVEKGTYYENVIINKTLWLIGENDSVTIIDGKGMDSVVRITTDNVNITGFSIQNSGSTWPNDFGVDLSSRRYCTIENCVIKNHAYSVYLEYAYNNTVRNNIITNSSVYSVFIYAGDNNTVINNTITNNKSTGVQIEQGSEGNVIANNNISLNLNAGVYVLHSDSNFIINNLLSFTGPYGTPVIYPGIRLMYSNNNTLARNIIFNNTGGIIIFFDWSSVPAQYNIIKGNVIENNDYGIRLHYGGNQSCPSTTTYNQVYENTLKNNGYGLYLTGVDDNSFYHNNLLGSTIAQVVVENSTNSWDNGLEGNYWSNYTGVDSNHDGIGDTPHIINENNTDNYPLMGMFSDFNVSSEHHVQTICNSTISDFQFNGTAISFNVTGENGTAGFCRICIPVVLMNGMYKVFVNGTEVLVQSLPCSNETHSYLYFTYNHSTQQVVIISEFLPFIVMPIFMISTLFAVVVVAYRRKHTNMTQRMVS